MFHPLKNNQIKKALGWGIMASLAMAAFYLAIMSLTMPPKAVWLNFAAAWHLISGIILGFGIQTGLWVYLKHCTTSQAAGTLAGTSGVMSGTAMVACCAHHVTDVVPLLGLASAASFLTQYQKPFLILGVTMNLLSISYMLHLLWRHQNLTKLIK